MFFVYSNKRESFLGILKYTRNCCEIVWCVYKGSRETHRKTRASLRAEVATGKCVWWKILLRDVEHQVPVMSRAGIGDCWLSRSRYDTLAVIRKPVFQLMHSKNLVAVQFRATAKMAFGKYQKWEVIEWREILKRDPFYSD